MGRLQSYYNAEEEQAKQGDSFGGTYLGFIDVIDICGTLFDLAAKEIGTSASQKEWSNAFLGKLGTKFLEQKLINVLGNDGDLLWAGFYGTKTLLDVCTASGLLNTTPYRPGVFSPSSHRIAVFSSDGSINNIVSQSDIIRFLQRHRNDIPKELLNETVENLFYDGDIKKQPSGSVHVVPSTLPAIQALAKLHEMDVSALGVVSDEGILLSNLSASDLRGIDTDHLEWLALPVGQYLSIVHARDAEEKREKKRRISMDAPPPSAATTAAQASPRRVAFEDPSAAASAGFPAAATTNAGHGGSSSVAAAASAASSGPSRTALASSMLQQGGSGAHVRRLSFEDERVLQEARRRLFPITTQISSRRQAIDAMRVEPTSTLGDVLRIVAENHIHRVYVVDSIGRALGVIANTDILRMLLQWRAHPTAHNTTRASDVMEFA